MATRDLETDRLTGAARSPFDDPDGGWAKLMELAANFPLEMLSFGGSRAAAVDPLPLALPEPRAVSYDGVDAVDYDDVISLVDGVGLSLATW